MKELPSDAQLTRIETILQQHVSGAAKTDLQMADVVAELRQIKDQTTRISRIVEGVDGGNGLREEVRSVIGRLEILEKTIIKMQADENARNNWIANWGWKILVAIAGAAYTVYDMVSKAKKG